MGTLRPVLAYALLAFGISWGIFAIGKWVLHAHGGMEVTAVSALFMLGPAISTLLLRNYFKLTWRQLGIVRHGIHWPWMGIALLIALAIPILTLGINWLLGDLMHWKAFGHTSVSKAMMMTTVGKQMAGHGIPATAAMDQIQGLPLNGPAILLISLITGAIAGCSVNFVFAMGEELGWRGMLFCWTRPWGLLSQVVFTGLLWGTWHLPLILQGHNYPDHPIVGVAMMCLFTLALATPMAWVRIRSRCIWSAGIMHGTVNAVAGSTLLFTDGASSLAGGPAGLSAVLALLVITAVLFLADPYLPKQFRSA
jgi:hypothetical protein